MTTELHRQGVKRGYTILLLSYGWVVTECQHCFRFVQLYPFRKPGHRVCIIRSVFIINDIITVKSVRVLKMGTKRVITKHEPVETRKRRIRVRRLGRTPHFLFARHLVQDTHRDARFDMCTMGEDRNVLPTLQPKEQLFLSRIQKKCFKYSQFTLLHTFREIHYLRLFIIDNKSDDKTIEGTICYWGTIYFTSKLKIWKSLQGPISLSFFLQWK